MEHVLAAACYGRCHNSSAASARCCRLKVLTCSRKIDCNSCKYVLSSKSFNLAGRYAAGRYAAAKIVATKLDAFFFLPPPPPPPLFSPPFSGKYFQPHKDGTDAMGCFQSAFAASNTLCSDVQHFEAATLHCSHSYDISRTCKVAISNHLLKPLPNQCGSSSQSTKRTAPENT